MPVAIGRTLSRLVASGAAATLLVAGLATSASATTYHHLTLAQAKAALPSSTSLPGHVKRDRPVSTYGYLHISPCETKPKQLTLVGQGTLVHYTNGAKYDSGKLLEYQIAILAYSSPKTAAVSLEQLYKADTVCPKRSVSGGEVVTRTLLAKTSYKSFSGYRVVDHDDFSVGKSTIGFRDLRTVLVRGNALVILSVSGSATATNAKVQDWERKVATTLVANKLLALK